MKHFYFLVITALMTISAVNGQTIFEENFDNASLPAGWTIQTTATDGGWKVGAANVLSSQGFGIQPNGSARMIATNDDACNCNKSNEYLISPIIDLTGQSSLILSFDAYYQDNSYQGAQEDATIEITTDGGVSWEILQDLEGDGDWFPHSIDLSDWVDEDAIQIRFRYDDGGGWVYGFALDNVVIKVPPTLEMALSSIDERAFGEVGMGQYIAGKVYNASITPIESMQINYEVTDGTNVTETISGLNIAPFTFYEFELPTPWVPTSVGTFEVMVSIIEANGMPDENQANNLAFYSSEIFDQVIVPNRIPELMAADPEINIISGASNLLEGPNDLAFFPINARNELWVINQRTENSGGSTVTISDATAETPSNFNRLVDGNAWHFMSLPTGIAFSDDNFNFASSPGVQDANHGGGTFTGPSLWSSDLDIYAQPSGGNGSHLDMLHGSPFSMGIAHEVDNVFWIYDDWNEDIVRYDFVDDHGPGNDDHSDAIVRRYEGIGINSITNIPNHMKVDKATGWLYFVDNGNNRVMRLDINSGSVMGSIPLINEPLAEHSGVGDFAVEEIINTGLDQACGLEIFENYLLIGDFATGDILVYDLENDFAPLGVIATGNPGLTGITVGPDGNIWFTNRTENTLSSAAPGVPSSANQINETFAVNISPNPSTGLVNIGLTDQAFNSPISLNVLNAAGKTIYSIKQLNIGQELDLSAFSNGVYLLNFKNEDLNFTKKLILNK